MTARALFWMASADFLQRVRGKGFLVAALAMVVVATLYLPALDAPYATATIGGLRGVYDSAWIGAVTACLSCVFFSLAAFYLVRGAIYRDEKTRFGQILAATPVSKIEYVLGKTLSNFAYLATLTGIIALSGAAIQLVRAEDLAVNPVELLLPTVIVVWPTMLLVAAVAVLFDCMPLLGGGVGSVAYFALYLYVVALSLNPSVHSSAPDPLGVRAALEEMARAAHSAGAGDAAPNVGINPAPANLGTFDFGGLSWDVAELVARLAWTGAALPMVLAAALFFSRFDPARRTAVSLSALVWRKRRVAVPDTTDRGRFDAARQTLPTPVPNAKAEGKKLLTPLADRSVKRRFVPLVFAELKVMLKGQSWWWYLGAFGFVVAGFAAPLEAARGIVLPLAWLWPLLVWSSLGSRETRHRVSEIVFSAPRVRSRGPLAVFAAGAIFAGLTASGVALNMGLSGDLAGLFALVAGALFVSALAVACGVFSGVSTLFEGLYLPLWYLGPFNKLPVLDFAGASGAGRPLAYLTLAAVLVCATLAARRRG